MERRKKKCHEDCRHPSGRTRRRVVILLSKVNDWIARCIGQAKKIRTAIDPTASVRLCHDGRRPNETRHSEINQVRLEPNSLKLLFRYRERENAARNKRRADCPWGLAGLNRAARQLSFDRSKGKEAEAKKDEKRAAYTADKIHNRQLMTADGARNEKKRNTAALCVLCNISSPPTQTDIWHAE